MATATSNRKLYPSTVEDNKSACSLVEGSGALVGSVDSVSRLSSSRRILINTTSSLKMPYLPKLPEKQARIRAQQETHFIGGFYMNHNFLRTKSSALNKKRHEATNPVLVQGDLLKARQILYALDSNMSGSIKYAKTSDTPWNTKSASRYTAKPSRSVLNKTRVQSSAFYRHSNNDSALSFSNSNSISSAANRAKSASSLSPDSRRTHLNSALAGRMRIYASHRRQLTNVTSELEKNTVRVERFAEDLLTKHYRHSINPLLLDHKKSDEPIKKVEPDIALHALNTIWEVHSYAVQNSAFLSALLEYQKSLPPTSETISKLEASRQKSMTSATSEYLNRLTHMLLEIDDPVITKHSLAVALGNLYHPDVIEVPGRLAGEVLAVANLLNFTELRESALEKMSHSLSEKLIADCYRSATRYNEKRAVELCENWLEVYLVPCLSAGVFLRGIPFSLLVKTFTSTRMFTNNEYTNLIVAAKWIFLQLNPELNKLPTDNIIITYFSSFSKEKPFVERYPEYSKIFYLIRLYGITNSNSLNTIQHMNIYPQAHILKAMMEVHHSMTHGGDMLINRQFETSSIRRGFVLTLGSGYYSEVFILYGFVFEIVSEQVSEDVYKFYIQRLSTDDPSLSYEQNQLEAFSLRTDRCCTYSINVQFWHAGNRVLKTTGLRKQRFGKAKSKTSKAMEVVIPQPQNEDREIPIKEILVLFSFIFPPD